MRAERPPVHIHRKGKHGVTCELGTDVWRLTVITTEPLSYFGARVRFATQRRIFGYALHDRCGIAAHEKFACVYVNARYPMSYNNRAID